MPSTNPLKDDESIIDLGSHNEPDLEAVVAAEPTLIINGQRFAQYHDDFVSLAPPDAVVLELDPRDDQPFADELKRQISVLGTIFDKETEAEELGSAFDASMERVSSAYNGSDKVMAVNVSGGEIGFIAPRRGPHPRLDLRRLRLRAGARGRGRERRPPGRRHLGRGDRRLQP